MKRSICRAVSWSTFVLIVVALAGGAARAQAQGGTKGVLIGLSQPAANSPVGTLEIDGMTQSLGSIYGFGFGVTQASGGAVGGGGGAGKASFTDVHVLRVADAVSPQLFRAAALGVHLPAVKITLFASGKTVPEATYVLRDVLVSGISSAPGTESVSFSFASVEFSAGGQQFCFDVKANAAC